MSGDTVVVGEESENAREFCRDVFLSSRSRWRVDLLPLKSEIGE